MNGAEILIVEDDHELRGLLIRGLNEEGYQARGVQNGQDAWIQVAERRPDALVVDIGLPDSDGRDLTQALRARGITAPVLFLTARDSLTDRLSGFTAGGDDYLTKPFAFEELLARLRALLRRAGTDGRLEAWGLTLDPLAHAVTAEDQTRPLTPLEFRLLARLLANPGETVRRRDLVRAGWPHGAIVHHNTLDVYIARLRRKLDSLPNAPAIKTLRGIGYRLI